MATITTMPTTKAATTPKTTTTGDTMTARVSRVMGSTTTATGGMTTRHDCLFFHQCPMDNGVDDEGDGVMDNDSNNGDGATDDDVDEDGDGDGATDDDGDGDGNGATDDNDDNDNDGNDRDGAAADDNNVDDNNNYDIDNVDDDNLPPRIGKRSDGCDETKMEEEEMVADSVAIHTTIKQITGRAGGRWRGLRQRRR